MQPTARKSMRTVYRHLADGGCTFPCNVWFASCTNRAKPVELGIETRMEKARVPNPCR